jgi:hypothetical protein
MHPGSPGMRGVCRIWRLTVVRFKPEVRIGYFDRRLGDVFTAASVWSLEKRVDVEVNSIADGVGVHMPASLHPYGLAIDLDTVGDKPIDLRSLADYLRVWLPAPYDVVYETDHVHVEYDVKHPLLRKSAAGS